MTVIAAIAIIAGIADVPTVIGPITPISSITVVAGIGAIGVSAHVPAAVDAIVGMSPSTMPCPAPASAMSSSTMVLSDGLGRHGDQQSRQDDKVSMKRAARHRAPAFLRVVRADVES